MSTTTPRPKGCSKCARSGFVALWVRDLSYAGPGPVPEDAGLVCDAPCDCDLGRSIAEHERRAREAFRASHPKDPHHADDEVMMRLGREVLGLRAALTKGADHG